MLAYCNASWCDDGMNMNKYLASDDNMKENSAITRLYY